MPRRRSNFFSPRPRSRSVLLTGSQLRPARRRRRRGLRQRRGRGYGPSRIGPVLVVLVVLAAVVGGVVLWRTIAEASEARHDAAQRFATAWAGGDRAAMWQTLTPQAQAAHPRRLFDRSYRTANREAGVRDIRVGRVGSEQGDEIAFPAAVRTKDFRRLRGTITLPVSGRGDEAGVDWNPSLRLPGLRRGETVRERSGREPLRAQILAADGSDLAAMPLGTAITGRSGENPTGLERVYDDRLGGHPSARLYFGRRLIARSRAVRGRPVRTTIKPGLSRRAQAALGGKVGGVAVIRPRDGAVQALAGLAVSAPQPPGSTFKIITLSAALEHKVASPGTSYPVRTATTLSGVTLRNAGGESCGGTLTNSFIHSCNSVFAPLGAKLGARRLVAAARDFGFNERSRVPGARPGTISPVSRLRDDLAVGAAAIGQDRDLATPLGMASVGATIAMEGRRARPRITTLEPVVRKRVVSRRIAGQVRSMMLGVVRSGTGTAASIPGVEVAGKTGTAELRPNSTDPKDSDAWFVAFAPASKPEVAVAVMLVGAGAGGDAAAPVARRVLQAALG